MWKLKNIKWWWQISIFISKFFASCSLCQMEIGFISSRRCLALRAEMKMFSHRNEGKKCLVKLKTYKSLKSCYVEPQRCLWKAGIWVEAAFINYSHEMVRMGKVSSSTWDSRCVVFALRISIFLIARCALPSGG